MKIELKKFKLVHGHDDDVPFTADLYVDGVLTARCENDGWGGGTQFHVINKAKYDAAEAFAKTQKDPRFPDLELNLDCILDTQINAEIAKIEDKKEKARMKRYFKKNVVVGVPGANSFMTYEIKNGVDYWMADPARREKLRTHINNIKMKLKAGEVILNDNLQGVL